MSLENKKESKKNISTKPIFAGVFLVASLFLSYTTLPKITATKYENIKSEKKIEEIKPDVFVATHIKTPVAVKAIYMTACAASTPSMRDGLIKLIDTTEINSLVLNIKDETGKISFDVENPELKDFVAQPKNGECKIDDIKGFIKTLHEKNIYVIGRIPVFQDLYMTKKRPELAVKKASDGSVWQDRKGIRWLDTGSKEVWDYTISIGKESYDLGFDELNFDYVRFPTDGNMKEIYFPFSNEKLLADPINGKANILKSFFVYLNKNLKNYKGKGADNSRVVLSADLFGMTTNNTDDLGIGQILENAIPYFDYIAPMVYPSHYPPGFNNWKNPNDHPYELIKFVMSAGAERLTAASTTPLKLRPWLQDFDYGGNYDIPEVKAQIQATYDSGLTSWMLWSPSNKYTTGALKVE